MSEPVEFFESLDEISVDFERHGVPTCVEVGRNVISKVGSWALLMFFVHTRSKGNRMRPRVMLHRYRLIGGGWRKSGSLNIEPDHLIKAAELVSRYLAAEPPR